MKHYKFKGSKFNYSAHDKKDVEKFLKRLNSLKPVYFPFVRDLLKNKVNFKELTFVMHLILNMMKYSYDAEISFYEICTDRAFYEICTDRAKRQRIINSLLLVMNKRTLIELGSLPKHFFWDKNLTDIDFSVLKLIDKEEIGANVKGHTRKYGNKQSKKKKA